MKVSGYSGQKYEIRYTDTLTNKEVVAGWTDDENGGTMLAQAKLNPRFTHFRQVNLVAYPHQLSGLYNIYRLNQKTYSVINYTHIMAANGKTYTEFPAVVCIELAPKIKLIGAEADQALVNRAVVFTRRDFFRKAQGVE